MLHTLIVNFIVEFRWLNFVVEFRDVRRRNWEGRKER